MDRIMDVLRKIEEKHLTSLEQQSEEKCQCGRIIYRVLRDIYGLNYPKGYCRECFDLIIDARCCDIFPPKFALIKTDREDQLKSLRGKSVFLTGDPGTGKTVFACSYGREFLKQDKKAVFYSYPSLIMEFQGSYKDDSTEGPEEKLKRISRCNGLIILDDLGGEKITDFARQITYCIINEREMRCLPIAITSNFSLSQLAEQIDPRISSRIAGMCEVIKLTGKDRRIK